MNVVDKCHISPSSTQGRPVIGEWTVAVSEIGTAGQTIRFGLSRVAAGSDELVGDLYLLGLTIEFPVV